MPYAALATDYDGTIAHDGAVDAATVDALERLRAAQRRLVLVTGRELDGLHEVIPRLDLFDRVVVENGAVLYDPATRTERRLADPPPPAFAERLRARGVSPLSVGRVIVATWEPNETVVLETIRDLGLELQITFNKGAVMVLPAGVHKGTGLRAALAELGLSPLDCVGVGDAENDLAFLGVCGLPVAVANALDSVKAQASLVTRASRGAGVAELIGRMLRDDLADLDARAPRQRVALAAAAEGDDTLDLVPRRDVVLLAGASGGGKSTLTFGLLERLERAGFQYCVIDPEGDYEGSIDAVSIGTADTPPDPRRVMEQLRRLDGNLIVNLLGLAVADRPSFLGMLLPELVKLRGETGRPHFVVVDEAHHMLPADWDPGAAVLPADFSGLLFVTVHPDRLSPRVLDRVGRLLVVGADAGSAAAAFCNARGLGCRPGEVPLKDGEVLTFGVDDVTPRVMRVIPSEGARRRHVRKYAEGKLGEDKSFYFRGPEGRLNLRAHNLTLFAQMSDGVDDATWEHHRRAGDYSRWVEGAIKDAALAAEVAAIERGETGTAEARADLRRAIEARYTLPA